MTTETLPAPVETVTPIKPSEAIRLGCLIAPVQAFGNPGDMKRTACVHGAAFLGGMDDFTDVFVARFPIHVPVPCPEGCPTGSALHLNDDHRWSRERIADWLEGLGL